MSELLNIGAGYRSQIIVAVAATTWGLGTFGIITPEMVDQGIQIMGILFGGTFAAKVQRLVTEMGSSE